MERKAIRVRGEAFELKEAAETRRLRIIKSQSRPVQTDEDTPDEPVTGNDDEESDTDSDSNEQPPEKNDKRVSENEDSRSPSSVIHIEDKEGATTVETPLRETTRRETNGKDPKESVRQLSYEDAQYDPSPSSVQEKRQGMKNKEYDLRERRPVTGDSDNEPD